MRFDLIYKALKNPREAFRRVRSLKRTLLFKCCCKILRKKVYWGKRFHINGKLDVKGPGKVIFGDNVTISMKVTPWTYAHDACIKVGNNVFLNGTKFGCKKSIEIGSYSIIGESRIQDTNFHSLYINRHDDHAPIKEEPVIIGENVWIPPDCQVLPGSAIGNNSVIGINSVVNSRIEQDSLAAGNPAKKVKSLKYYYTETES